jgi:tRNA(Ile)-lysidine synthase
MITRFEKKILKFIEQNELLPQQGRILVAVSGGADSIALLHTLWTLKAMGHINVDLICAHLNHKLRGSDADRDEDFVENQTVSLQLRLVKSTLDITRYAKREKLSIETAARKWRLETLQEMAQKNNCGHIVTGHHKDDNAETIIQRLLRGTGFRGLGGIWPKRSFDTGAYFVRPMLCVTRDEILEYLKQGKNTFREDATNAQLKYTRNLIRHKFIPHLQKECSSPLADQLWNLSSVIRKVNKRLRDQVESLWQQIADAGPDRVNFELKDFNTQPEPVRIELIRESLIWLGSGEKDLTEQHYLSTLELTQQNISNRILELPGKFRVWREYKRLVFASPERAKYKERTSSKTIKINVPAQTTYANYNIEP